LLHADTANGIPEPFHPTATVANTNYALTDYTEEKRVAWPWCPGSHRMHRQPTKWEDRPGQQSAASSNVIAIRGPAGFSGRMAPANTWHGSFPRKKPRAEGQSRDLLLVAKYIQTQEAYRYNVPDGYLQAGRGAAWRASWARTSCTIGRTRAPVRGSGLRHREIGLSRTWQNWTIWRDGRDVAPIAAYCGGAIGLFDMAPSAGLR